MRQRRLQSSITGMNMATTGGLFRKALPKVTRSIIRNWATTIEPGRPNPFAPSAWTAPVLTRPETTTYMTATVARPSLPKPAKPSPGSSTPVTMRNVRAAINTASGASRVPTRQARVRMTTLMVSHASLMARLRLADKGDGRYFHGGEHPLLDDSIGWALYQTGQFTAHLAGLAF